MATSMETQPRCRAHNRQGQQCGRPPVPGATVCSLHGGKAPQVRRAANLRLLELVDPAIATLAREMVSAPRSSDRQRAANSILDRAGIARTVSSTDAETARALLIQRLIDLRDSEAEEEDAKNITVVGTVIHPEENSGDREPNTPDRDEAPVEPQGRPAQPESA